MELVDGYVGLLNGFVDLGCFVDSEQVARLSFCLATKCQGPYAASRTC